MDDYLIGRETLEQFVDELMKQKPTAANTPEELNQIREKAIADLDKKIGYTLIRSMDEGQLATYEDLIHNEETTEEQFEEFFQKAGIDLEKVMTYAVAEFGKEFLGGNNE